MGQMVFISELAAGAEIHLSVKTQKVRLPRSHKALIAHTPCVTFSSESELSRHRQTLSLWGGITNIFN